MAHLDNPRGCSAFQLSFHTDSAPDFRTTFFNATLQLVQLVALAWVSPAMYMGGSWMFWLAQVGNWQRSNRPTGQPYNRPTGQPSNRPTVQPANRPTGQPSSRPTVQPSNRPTGQPSNRPTVQPANPTGQPNRPTVQPANPTGQPNRPTGQPNRPTGQLANQLATTRGYPKGKGCISEGLS